MDTAVPVGQTVLKDSIATAVACEKVFNVFAKPSPLKQEVLQSIAPQGMTLAGIVEGLDHSMLEIEVNGTVIPAEYWTRLRPKAGSSVVVRGYPQGKTVKKIIAIVIMIVVIYFTAGAGAGAFASMLGTTVGTTTFAIASMALTMVAQLAISALVKPPAPKLGSTDTGGTGDTDRTNSITGTSNAFQPYGVQPCVIGEMRFFPPNCAMPYTEMEGDTQYLRMLLDLGPGDLQVSELKIGEDDLTTYEDVEYQIGLAPSLYSNDVFELGVGVTLESGDPPVVRTSALVTDELIIELAYPQGLYGADTQGTTVQVTDSWMIEYRKVGSPTWLKAVTAAGLKISHAAVTVADSTKFKVVSSSRTAIRCAIKIPVTQGQYEVQITKYGVAWGTSDPKARLSDFGWTALKSVRHTLPNTMPTTKFAARIKATDQLNGTISTLNCRVKQVIKVWDGSAWVYEHTNNPAWEYLWLLTACPANPRLMAESRVDIEGLKLWAIDCDAKGLTYANIIDGTTTVFELLADICAAGKASFTVKDGVYSVVRDVQQTVPVQMFTPRNSREFGGSRVFGEEIHALRCGFVNTQAGWQKDMRIVYAEGYNSGNAEKFEDMDMRGMIDPNAVWRLGSYHLAVLKHRQNTYTLKTDFEHLVCQRGDLILVAHPVCQWGNGWGRVNSVTLNGSNVKSVSLDEKVELKPFADNVIQFRKEDGTLALSSVKSTNVLYSPSFAYTRNSIASYRGQDGMLKYADANNARVAYAADASLLGLEIEGASTNYLLWSELINDPVWVRTQVTLDAVAGVAPDGSSSAMRLSDNATNSAHYIRQTVDAVGGDMTISAFVKKEADGLGFVRLKFGDGVGGIEQVYDLTNRTLGSVNLIGADYTLLDSGFEEWTDDWVRIWMTADVSANATQNCSIFLHATDSGSDWSYVGTGKGVLVWGMQVERQNFMSSYIPTGGATVTRAADIATLTNLSEVGFDAVNGTIVAEYSTKSVPAGTATYGSVVSLNGGSTAERLAVHARRDVAQSRALVVDGGVTQASLSVNLSGTQHVRTAFAYGVDSFHQSTQGGAVVADLVGTMPTCNQLQIGHELGSSSLNGWIKSVHLLSDVLSDAALQMYSEDGYSLEDGVLYLKTQLPDVLEGDLAVVGIRGEETARLIVTRIQPGKDLEATITCVDEAPEVYAAGAGAPPAFISTITNQRYCAPPPPPKITAMFTTYPPPAGGGGTPGGCVVVESEVHDFGKAGDLTVGQMMTVIDPITGELDQQEVTYSEAKLQPCVLVTTESGVELECSNTAPISDSKGQQIKAPDLYGHKVLVWENGVLRVEKIVSVKALGKRMVQHITCGDKFFLAGKVAGKYLLHHNAKFIGPRNSTGGYDRYMMVSFGF